MSARAKLRPTTIGTHHAQLAALYRDLIDQGSGTRARSAFSHICTHLDAQGRLLGQAEALHAVIGARSFRDRQRAVLGSAQQTLSDLARSARSAKPTQPS